MKESVQKGERAVIGGDFSGQIGEGKRDDEEVLGKYGFKERKAEVQTKVD